jgi:hypothetical protein
MQVQKVICPTELIDGVIKKLSKSGYNRVEIFFHTHPEHDRENVDPAMVLVKANMYKSKPWMKDNKFTVGKNTKADRAKRQPSAVE